MNGYQSPAEGILLIRDYGASKMYHVACDCGNPDDAITLDVEADDCGVSIQLYSTTRSNWYANTWYERVANRIRLTWKLWTTGYLQYEAVTCLSEQQAINLTGVIQEAIDDVRRFKQDHVSKNS
jgi:hypothetical protein